MSVMHAGATAQLRTIGWVHTVLSGQGIDYWLFGGWAVDFHARRVTRDHVDVDVCVWAADFDRVRGLLEGDGWRHAPEPGDDGYTGYERGDVRLELAILERDDGGTVFTPLRQGRGEWPAGSFGDDEAGLAGVVARVVGLTPLLEDKSGPRLDQVAADKDRADVAVLAALRTGGVA
jgi:hypothetical protein